MGGNLGGSGLEHQLAAGMPAATVMALAAEAAGHARPPAPIGRFQPAARALGDPTSRLAGHGKAVAHTHFKLLLRRINGGHARPEMGAMHFIGLHHPMHPGVDHLVAERAGSGQLGQGL